MTRPAIASHTRKASDTQVSPKLNTVVGGEDHRDAEATERDQRREVDLPAVARQVPDQPAERAVVAVAP